MELFEAGDEDSAIEQYLAALALDPGRPSALYNLGLIYKYRRDWRTSLDYNRLARELRPHDEATLWNLAIAATALQDWRTARDVWRTLNIISEPDEGPINENFGDTPLRLNAVETTDTPAEVVWARRLCPVRARIRNIPTGATGFRHGDVVLHDGAAVGYRLNSDGEEVPAFNVLELFEPSRFSTFEATVEVDGPEDIEVLDQACDRADVAFEDWTASIRSLCKACSEGRPHEGHDRELKASDSWERMRRVGFAAHGEASITTVLQGWQDRRRRVADLRCTLDARLS
jgi:tetratricopeptide (TPR) repeat protein